MRAGSKPIAASYAKSLDRILFGAAHFVARALGDLHRDPDAMLRRAPLQTPDRSIAIRGPARCSGSSREAPAPGSPINSARCSGTSNGRSGSCRQPLERLFAAASGNAARVQGVEWLPERKGRFLADPFPIPGARRHWTGVIIAEEYDWKSEPRSDFDGRVAGLQAPRRRPAIRQPASPVLSLYHEHARRDLVRARVLGSGEVAVYRRASDDGDWVKHKVIVADFPAIDPTLFEYGGRWWLLCTSADTGANECLYAWHAEDLFGEWLPHPANPLKVDIRGARPAGRPFLLQRRAHPAGAGLLAPLWRRQSRSTAS